MELHFAGFKEVTWQQVERGSRVWIIRNGELAGPFRIHNWTLHWLVTEADSVFPYYGEIFVKEA